MYATTTKRDERVLLENVRVIPILLGALLIFARRARRLEGRVAVDAGDADAEKNGGRHRSGTFLSPLFVSSLFFFVKAECVLES